MNITFDPINGSVYPDGRVITEIRRLLTAGQDFTIGGESEFTAVRYLFLFEFPDLDITLIFGDKTTTINKHGSPEDWFSGMGDFTIGYVEKILLENMRRRRIEKESKRLSF